ncbi:hypothetical protein CSOJ01_14543 [Colletotrichum sojae]|uniref:Uncharacterized protein n=1 Tax=Colletotrichum sojae TaxID=2175907 RepID=A0A8H6IPK6_9PEZI|nr:hypothetical protein CSOJ01_14543 [Colletotrichum sojae]
MLVEVEIMWKSLGTTWHIILMHVFVKLNWLIHGVMRETLTWVKQVFANRRTAKYKNQKIPISIEGPGIEKTSTLGELFDVIQLQYENTVKAFDILRLQVPQNLWPTPDGMKEVPSASLFELVWRDKLNGSIETRDEFNREALKGKRSFSRYLVWTIQFFAEERDQPEYTHGLRLIKSGHEISHSYPEVTVVCSGIQYDGGGKVYFQHSDIFLGSSNEKTHSFRVLHDLTRKGREDALQPIRNKYGDFIDKLKAYEEHLLKKMPRYDANKATNAQDPSLLGFVRFKIVTGKIFQNDTIAEFKSIWGDEIDEIPRICDADVSSHVALVFHNENLSLKAIACYLLCKIFIVTAKPFLSTRRTASRNRGVSWAPQVTPARDITADPDSFRLDVGLEYNPQQPQPPPTSPPTSPSTFFDRELGLIDSAELLRAHSSSCCELPEPSVGLEVQFDLEAGARAGTTYNPY